MTVRREHGRRACVTDTELSSKVGSSGTELRGLGIRHSNALVARKNIV